MKVPRGSVVLIDFPFSDGTGSKVRPALVVQADGLKASEDRVIAAISTSVQRSATCVIVDPLPQPPGPRLVPA